MTRTVAVAGLGAIGLPLARALDGGIDGLQLVAVAAHDLTKARAKLAGFRNPPALMNFADLADADFVPCSVGALLPRLHLVKRAQQTGARIIVPTGALLGLDAVRAVAEGRIDSIEMETRKPPASLIGAPYLRKHGYDMLDVTMPLRVFSGNARDAALGFPANVNVAAALALAGIGPVRTKVEIWADPGLTRNVHIIRVEAEAARFTMRIENEPSEDNPRTGKITPLSVVACLRGLVSPLKVGS
jgi:aspartate dehydrogenase